MMANVSMAIIPRCAVISGPYDCGRDLSRLDRDQGDGAGECAGELRGAQQVGQARLVGR